jgi:methylenetetrahydrofolate reductase (NADPH)
LRGDLPSGMAETGEFRYANELVEFIRAETGDWFSIEVAAYPEWHPQAKSPKDDLDAFRPQGESRRQFGDYPVLLQCRRLLHFVDEAKALGVEVPIIPGIMPIAGFTKLARFSDACGADIPRWMRKKFESFGDDAESIRAFGLDVVTDCASACSRAAPPACIFMR